MVLMVTVLAVTLHSCAKKPKVIPRSDMQKIYREMFIADQWISKYPSHKLQADTAWFYGAIFEKYGYTTEDYRNSVRHYLSDPERYAKMLRKVRDGLKKETERLYAEIMEDSRRQEKLDSIADFLRSFAPKDFGVLEYYRGFPVYDSVCVEVNADGAAYFKSEPGDTIFQGPAMIIKDTVSVTDTLTTIGHDKDSSFVSVSAEPRGAVKKRLPGVR